jgi:hypothetical protein
MPTSKVPAGMVESHDLDGNRILEPRTKGQLKIESKGDSVYTCISVDGCVLTGVTSATWSVSVNGIAKATLTFDDVALELDLPFDRRDRKE